MAQAIPFIAAAASAASTLMQVGQQRAVLGAEARAKEIEAATTRQEAGLQVEALGRETRRQFGETRAAGSEMGLLDSVTFGDVYKQAATAAELDAANLAYQGETQAQGLLTEAKIARAARPSWAMGTLQAAASGLGAYSSAGGSFERAPKLEEVKITSRKRYVAPTTRMTTSDISKAVKTPRRYGTGLIGR
jgi:hypothetical protein